MPPGITIEVVPVSNPLQFAINKSPNGGTTRKIGSFGLRTGTTDIADTKTDCRNLAKASRRPSVCARRSELRVLCNWSVILASALKFQHRKVEDNDESRTLLQQS